jgi:HAD superfamily hydrolase (TIGR01509 family)
MIKAIVFDFDGVIIDSEKIWLDSKIKALKINNIKIKSNIKFKSLVGISSNVFFKKFIPKKIYPNIIHKIVRSYNALLIKNFSKNPKLNKDILEILKELNLEFAIVSNNSSKFIIKSLKSHKILKYFKKKFIIGLRKTKFKKPMPYGYLKILNALNCKTSEVIVIEDSYAGLNSAKNAKIKYIIKYNPFIIKKIRNSFNIRKLYSLKKNIKLLSKIKIIINKNSNKKKL